MTAAMHRTGASIALLARTVAGPAVVRAIPVWAGIAIVSAVVFGPNGMSAADVVSLMAGSPWARVILWAAWLIAVAPAVRTLYRGEGAIYLRSLPIPLALHLAVPVVVGVALQAPWIWLHLRGGGGLAGGWAAAVASAAGAVIAIRPRGALDQLLGLAAAAGLAAALGLAADPRWMAALAAAVYPLAVTTAWMRSPERGARGGWVRIGGPAPLALGLSALAWTWRGRRSVLGRTALWTAVGGVGIGFGARANDIAGASFGTLFVAVSGLAFAAALGAIATAMVDHERAARWLLDTTGAGGAVRVAAAAVPALSIGLGCGLAIGGLAAWLAGDPVRALAYGGAGGAGWSLIALAVARRCERTRGVDGTLVLVVLLVAAIALAVAAAILGEVAMILVLALAAGGSLWGADRAARDERAA